MKKVLFILILILASAGLFAKSDEFKPEFNGNKYLKVFKGSNDKISIGDKGTTLVKEYGKPEIRTGTFTVIGVDDTESTVLLQFSSEQTRDIAGKINHIGFSDIKKLADKENYKDILEHDYKDVRFTSLESRFFFNIKNKSKGENYKIGMKGQLTKKDELSGKDVLAGIFKIVGYDDDYTYGMVANNAEGVDFRQANSGVFQNYLDQIVGSTGFLNISLGNIVMIFIGIFFIYLGVAKDYEPLLLVPIGFGILIGNIPLPLQLFNNISVYMIDPVSNQYVFNTTTNSVMGLIYFGVRSGLFPPLIFLGIGAMTDFSALLSNPKSVLLGAAAQTGIFITFISALYLGFSPANAAAIGIIGGADGPTAIFLSSKLAPSLIGPIAIAAYSYMAMVPIIQPPIMKLLTTKEERLIKMKPGRKVRQIEKIMFPVLGIILTCMVAPGAIPLLGMLFFGNLLKESGVTSRLAKTASNALIDIATILLGVAVGASTSAAVFLNEKSILIFVLGVISFGVATACGVLFAKFMNLFTKNNKVNPLIGAAGVSAVPDSARVVHNVGREEDPNNFLLMHAMGPNVAGVIGSAIAAGVFLGIF